MDGQQRLDTIRAFFKNEFALQGLLKWPELNTRFFKDLPIRIQRGLERRGLAAVIILTESGKNKKMALEIRQYVFERLNTGGEKLNAQEVRNCINGIITCLEAKTGEIKYEGGRAPVPATFTSSPVAFDDKILLTSEDGDTFIIKAGPAFEVIRTNSLSEPVYASIAIAAGRLFIRGEKHLYCIGGN